MESTHPTVFVKNYEEGITRVKGGGYAFLMESTVLQYKVQVSTTEGPRLTRILGLGKTVLHEIRVSGTVVGPLLLQKSPTCTYISLKLC